MADPSPRPPAMTVRGLLSSSTGRALRATAPAIVVVSLLYAAQAGLTAVSPLMLQRIIDGAGPGASTSDIIIPGVLAAAAALAGAAVGVAVQQMTVSTGQRFQERLRVLMLGKLTRLPSSAVGSAPGGAMLSRITNDTAQAQSFVSSVLPQSFGLVVHLGVLVGVMWTRSYVITLTVLGLALLLVLPTEKVSRRLNTVTDRMLEAMSDFSGTVVERVGVTGHLFSRTAADIASDQRRAERTAAEVSRSYTRMITINSIFSSSLSLIGALGTVVILVVGGYYVIEGRMTVGALAARAALAPQLYEPLLGASGMRTGLATSWAALSRVHEFLESDEEWYEQPRVPADILIGGALIVRDVDYRVPSQTGEATLLHSVNLTARSGEIVAVVGPSGSGKSTLLSLIAGANRPTGGRITFGGISPADTGTATWNGIVQLCPQDAFFRSGTLLENFELVRPGIDEARVEELCERVGLDLSQLGERSGTSTMLGEHGMRISGGERARLAIARMLALDPCVLLFDEPTAALDDESSDRLIAILNDLRRDHCIVLTTHDARLVPVIDRSYRMEDGRLTPMRSLRSSRFLRSPRPPRSPALAGAEGRPS